MQNIDDFNLIFFDLWAQTIALGIEGIFLVFVFKATRWGPSPSTGHRSKQCFKVIGSRTSC